MKKVQCINIGAQGNNKNFYNISTGLFSTFQNTASSNNWFSGNKSCSNWN